MIAANFQRWFLLICFLSAFTACDKKYIDTPLPSASNVVILGDSLTYGTGAGDGEDYASVLASNTGWNVINAGVPGNTSSDGLARLANYLDAHASGEQRIDLLIIELGGNDFLKHVPESETRSNLKTILDQAKAKNVRTVLVAIPELSIFGAAFGTLSDHPLYEKLAKETDTPLVTNLFSEVLSNNSLKADAIHPNAAGYSQVAAELQNALVDFGFLRK